MIKSIKVKMGRQRRHQCDSCEPSSLPCVPRGVMLTPRQIIEDIRRNQYGIGLPADPASVPVIAAMRSKLDRALKLLSTDLYAKDIHFVLELLQNAEDNSYA